MPTACPARAASPTRELNFAENLLERRRADDDGDALVFWGEDKVKRARLARSAARASCRACSGARRARRRSRRSRRGLHAEHAGDDRRDAGRRGASARSGRRARRTSACRACSTASARSSRSVLFTVDGYWYNGKAVPIVDKVAQIVAQLPTVERVVVVPYLQAAAAPPADLSRGPAWAAVGRVARAVHRGADRLRAAAVRPSALHPLFVGHHRRAQVHRARRRRHAAPAPQGAPAALRRQARRSPVLLHHLRLDDVELARLRRSRPGATLLLYDGSPFVDRGRILWDFADAEQHDALRHLGEVHRRAARRSRWCRARTSRWRTVRTMLSTGSAARAGELRLRLPVREARRAPGVDLRRHRHRVAASRSAYPTLPGLARRDAGARPRAWTSTSSTRTAVRCGTPRASWCASRRSRRCRSASGTIRTAPSTAPRTSSGFPDVWCHGDWVRDHRARRPHHLRPLRRDAQSRRRAHRHRGDLPPGRAARRRSSRASSSARTGRPARSATCASCCS